MPRLAGATEEAPPEISTTRRARAARRRRRARQVALRRAVAIACLLGALFGLVWSVRALTAPTGAPARSVAGRSVAGSTQDAAAKGIYARPVRLMIPRIGLNAAIEEVGLTAGKAMASPSSRDTVGWYKLGPHPGNSGSAVIDGHSGYADGGAAAFDKLPELIKGDRLYVKDASGSIASFLVRKTRVYARDADATEVFAPTASSRLNLITCTGSFDVAAGTHSQRLVVFADLEDAERLAGQQ